MATLRRTLSLLIAAVVVAAACSDDGDGGADGPRATGGDPAVRERVAEALCELPESWRQRIWRGYRADRSAELQILPKVPNFVGAGLPHVGPWEHTSHVPMLWYGPGYIRAAGQIDQPATVADIAPTQAALLDFDFTTPDGRVLEEALVPSEERGGPPRLVVVNIWDGAGRNVLDEWPDDWPNLRG